MTLEVQATNWTIQTQGTTLVSPQQFQINDVNGKPENILITVSQVQGGYFALQTNTTLPLTTFSYYQVKHQQVIFVYNGTDNTVPQVTLTLDDGTNQSKTISPLITLFNLQGPTPEASVPVPLIAGLVSGLTVVAALAGFGLFKVRQHREHLKDKAVRQLAEFKDDEAAMYQVSDTPAGRQFGGSSSGLTH